MSGAVPPLPQYAFMAWCSVKAQGQLYLLLQKCLEKLRVSLVKLTLFLTEIRMEVSHTRVKHFTILLNLMFVCFTVM
jgi:hypothetical protein